LLIASSIYIQYTNLETAHGGSNSAIRSPLRAKSDHTAAAAAAHDDDDDDARPTYVTVTWLHGHVTAVVDARVADK